MALRKYSDDTDRFHVMSPGMWENDNTPTLGDWYAVIDEEDGGIIAYAGTEDRAIVIRDAFRSATGVR